MKTQWMRQILVAIGISGCVANGVNTYAQSFASPAQPQGHQPQAYPGQGYQSQTPSYLPQQMGYSATPQGYQATQQSYSALAQTAPAPAPGYSPSAAYSQPSVPMAPPTYPYAMPQQHAFPQFARQQMPAQQQVPLQQQIPVQQQMTVPFQMPAQQHVNAYVQHPTVPVPPNVVSMQPPATAQTATQRQSPAERTEQHPRWNRFRPPTTAPSLISTAANRGVPNYLSAATQSQPEVLPTPTARPDAVMSSPSPQPQSNLQPQSVPAPVEDPYAQQSSDIASSSEYGSLYGPTMSESLDAACGCQPCVPDCGPPPIKCLFGGIDLLYWTVGDCSQQLLVGNDVGTTLITTEAIEPEDALGYDIHFGTYLGCGGYALEFSYLNWNPSSSVQRVSDAATGLRYINPAMQDVSIDRGGGAVTVYDEYDNAAAIQAFRDIELQGLEVNLVCFGLMGARRLGSRQPSCLFGNCCGCGPCNSCDSCGGCGSGCGGCDTGCDSGCGKIRKAYGGAAGPLARGCSGCIRVMTSHGFRWLQINDDFQMAANVDGVAGYGPEDIYYDISTENNLFGYQFGSQLTYCLGCRCMINAGGKIGVYANDARYSQRLGTDFVLAYTNSQGAGTGDVQSDVSETCLSGLGELDLGIGYRISCRCTFRTGYRMLAATGVATTTGQMTNQYSSVASSSWINTDDSLLLHGVYVGLDCNW